MLMLTTIAATSPKATIECEETKNHGNQIVWIAFSIMFIKWFCQLYVLHRWIFSTWTKYLYGAGRPINQFEKRGYKSSRAHFAIINIFWFYLFFNVFKSYSTSFDFPFSTRSVWGAHSRWKYMQQSVPWAFNSVFRISTNIQSKLIFRVTELVTYWIPFLLGRFQQNKLHSKSET